MAPNRLILGILVLAALALTGHGGETKTPSYATPQAVFNAIKAAAVKGDYKGVANCYSAETRKLLAADFALAAWFLKGGALKAAEAKKDQPLAKVFKRHGLKDEMIKERFAEAIKGGQDDINKARLEIAEAIKDQVVFISDIVAAVSQLDTTGQVRKQFLAIKDAELRDVTVSGNTAKGTAVIRANGKDQQAPMRFLREGGGWRIDMAESIRKRPPF
jgi:hypothetical protein